MLQHSIFPGCNPSIGTDLRQQPWEPYDFRLEGEAANPEKHSLASAGTLSRRNLILNRLACPEGFCPHRNPWLGLLAVDIARRVWERESAIRAGQSAAKPTGTGWAQWEQRFASMGISLMHSGHLLVVGSAGCGALRTRAISILTGVTTKK